MIKKPTVLVLGAGASKPYNFPLGTELVDQISTEIIEGADTGRNEGRYVRTATPDDLWSLRVRLGKLGYPQEQIVELGNELRKARPYSVDAFLEARPAFREVGKAAIADVLLRAEASSTIGSAPAEVDWYRYLFNKILLIRRPDYFTEQAHQLTIITFNFDRSFEQALFSSVQANFGLDDSAARQLAAELRIHHIHGVLGEPDFLSGAGEFTTPYGPSKEELLKSVKTARGRIKIVDEEIDMNVVKKAERALRGASFVYFVGFGFDERNLKKVGVPDSLERDKVVSGSALGFTLNEQGPIRRVFSPDGGSQIQISLYSQDALTFLRDRAESLFH